MNRKTSLRVGGDVVSPAEDDAGAAEAERLALLLELRSVAEQVVRPNNRTELLALVRAGLISPSTALSLDQTNTILTRWLKELPRPPDDEP